MCNLSVSVLLWHTCYTHSTRERVRLNITLNVEQRKDVKNDLAFYKIFKGFQLCTSKVRTKKGNKIFHIQIENGYYGYNTSVKILMDNNTSVNIADVQMDVFT